MPKRNDINKILIIGSGPIVIGQACEFDYSGTQACKALKSLGYTVVLINSNPATIMTDPQTADAVYIEPLNTERIEMVIKKERPDAILPNLGGQSGLNLCSELDQLGILEENNVKVIGVKVDAIKRGEDRILFKDEMKKLGIEMAKSEPAFTIEEATKIAEELGYPVVIRPAYTMGGEGGGLVYNQEELVSVVSRGISASRVGQVLVEESVLGWEELELEIVRDSKNQLITVCYIENIDPMGVHTGDSFCSAPMLTISEDVQKRLQEAAYKIVSTIEVVGGTNVQFAHDPVSDRICVIEINPRTSRSSALASKATGFPIALVSALLACGLTLDEIECSKYGTLDKYVPCADYVVVKFPRFAFDKFKDSTDKLGTQMKAVGEVMSIGKTYKEAFQKAIRSLETGRYGLGNIKAIEGLELSDLLKMLAEPSSQRQYVMYQALKKGATVEMINSITSIKAYFIEQMQELVFEEIEMFKQGKNLSDETLIKAKKDGFSDKYISMLTNITQDEIRNKREKLNVVKGFEKIHVSGTKDNGYYYSTYNCEDTSVASENKNKIMILGGGPNRIGQGIEFDYCCVHASFALKKLGFETIIVNCNPSTVSTDYDTSDKLYFEPLTLEDVLSIYKKENPLGVIAQFGGQTPLNLAKELEANNVNILGTTPDTIDLAEDRDRFNQIMEKLNIPMPKSGMTVTADEALSLAHEIGYPVMVRPSYVLGGFNMEIIYDDETLVSYMNSAVDVSEKRPILIDRFLNNAIECEADAISDGTNVFVPSVMEHIELAGIHSGDSACVLPSVNISSKHIKTIVEMTKKIASELNVVGLMNMQYAICDDVVYVLEANPRASRTVPLVSKVCNINMVNIATNLMTQKYTNDPLRVKDLKNMDIPYYGVKEAVFPFNMFTEVDPVLGPQMKSTGEVLGLGESLGEAYYKSEEATGIKLPRKGNVFISINDKDKGDAVEVAKGFLTLGFTIYATEGTYKYLQQNNLNCKKINKLMEGRPNVLDMIANQQIHVIINTPLDKKGAIDDSYIRKAAIKNKINYITTLAAAKVAVYAINSNIPAVKSIQEYHKEIKEIAPDTKDA